MPTFNELVVKSFYQAELDRAPDDSELAHWAQVIELHGSAVFAEHVYSSSEAAEVRRKRTQRSPENLAANLAQADQYFEDLISEIDVTPIKIALTARAGTSLPAVLIDRLHVCSLVDLVEVSPQSPARIRVCDIADLDGSVVQEAAIVALLGAPDLAWTLSEFRYRNRVLELAHWRLATARLPANMRAGTEIEIRTPTEHNKLLVCPALLLEAESTEPRIGPQWAAQILAGVCLHHYFSGQPVRCMDVLDRWDLVMGTKLAIRYKAFSETLD